MRRRFKNDSNTSMRLRRYNGRGTHLYSLRNIPFEQVVLLCFAPENGQVDIDHQRRVAAVGLDIMLGGHDVVRYACLLILVGTR